MLKLQIFGPLSEEVMQRNGNFACLWLNEPPSAFLPLPGQVSQEGFLGHSSMSSCQNPVQRSYRLCHEGARGLLRTECKAG